MTGPERILSLVAMATDRNTEGDIFGGWLLGQADLAGSVLARQHAHGRVVTVAVREFSFKQPVLVADLVSFYGEVARIGRTSIDVSVHVEVDRMESSGRIIHLAVAGGTFVYVALDPTGTPRAITSP